MILPGISGAFILVLLGMYQFITGTLKELLAGLRHGTVSGDHLVVVGSFCLGCALGLVSFCKFLRWLLARYEAPTMAVLCGFMLGSLRKIWPFKSPAGENIGPDLATAGTWLTLGILVAAGLAILGIELWASYHGHDPQDELAPLEHPEPKHPEPAMHA
jgi:putative membrane protein